MPPKRVLTGRRGRPPAARSTSRGRGGARAREQPELEEIPPTASSVTPTTSEATPSAPPAPQSGVEPEAVREAAVQLLAQIMAQQVPRQEAGTSQAVQRSGTRVRDFLACGPPEFFGSKTSEDPQEFIRQMQRTLRVIGAADTESVELAAYRLQDVAANWYDSWLLSRGVGASPAVWSEFSEAFLAHFLPPEVRRAREDKFLALRQRGRSVREYTLEFDSLARYAPTIVASMSDRIHRYIVGLDPWYVDSCLVLAAQPGMDIARIQAHAQGMEDRRRGRQMDRVDDKGQSKRPRSSGAVVDSRGRQLQQQQSRPPPRSARSTPSHPPSRRSASVSQSGIGPGPSRQPGSSKPLCQQCGK